MARIRLNKEKWYKMKGSVTDLGESIDNEEAQDRILERLEVVTE